MRKEFKYYAIIWAVFLILFNVITFVPAIPKHTSSFWIGYIFITLSFVGQLICTYFALKASNAKKTFYNISLITTSYTGLVISFVVGGLCMLVPFISYWLAIIICAIVLALNITSVIKATVAIQLVEGVEEKVKDKTFFIKSLAVDAENLLARTTNEEVKKECKKVYEAIRYSDPMSHESLLSLEKQISICFSKLSEAVINEKFDCMNTSVRELMILLEERNRKCKMLKG